jgi:hypothetical protein
LAFLSSLAPALGSRLRRVGAPLQLLDAILQGHHEIDHARSIASRTYSRRTGASFAAAHADPLCQPTT